MWEGRHNVSGNDTIKKTISYKIMRNCLLCRDCCWYLHHHRLTVSTMIVLTVESGLREGPVSVTLDFINEQVNEPINCICLSSQIWPGGYLQLNSSIQDLGGTSPSTLGFCTAVILSPCQMPDCMRKVTEWNGKLSCIKCYQDPPGPACLHSLLLLGCDEIQFLC